MGTGSIIDVIGDETPHLMTFDELEPDAAEDIRKGRGDELTEEEANVEIVDVKVDEEGNIVDEKDDKKDADKTGDEENKGDGDNKDEDAERERKEAADAKAAQDKIDAEALAGADDKAGDGADKDSGDDQGDKGSLEDKDKAGADKGATDGADDGDKKGNSDTVPYARFKEVNDALKGLKATVDEMKANPPAAAVEKVDKKDDPPAFDLKAKISARNEAIADGDLDVANDIDMEIETHRQEQSDLRATAAANATMAQGQVAKVQEGVWERRGDTLTADKAQMERFVRLRTGLEKGGTPTHEALLEAEALIFGSNEVSELNKDADVDADAEAKAKAEADAAAKKEAQEKQKKDSVDRNAKAATQQPPATGKAGSSTKNDKRNVATTALELDDKEFDSLTEKELKIRRGDVVE